MEDKFDEFSLYKELYYHELDLKDKIGNRTNFAFGINTIIIGVIATIYKKAIDLTGTSLGIILAIILILLIEAYIISIFFIFKSFYGYKYDYLPSGDEIYTNKPIFEKYFDENRDYFESQQLSKEVIVSNCIKNNTMIIYRESASKNREQNLTKSRWLMRYSWSVVAIFSLVLICLGTIGISDFSEKHNTDDKIIIEILKGGEKLYEYNKSGK